MAIAEEDNLAAEQQSVKMMQPGRSSDALSCRLSAPGAANRSSDDVGSLQTLRRSRSNDATATAKSTPVQSIAQVGAALPWQTALGKRMRVSSEGMAAAASLLHRTPELPGAVAPQTVLTLEAHGVKHGPPDESGSAGTAEPSHIAGDAVLLDPGTPMQLHPAASLGQLSTSSTGRKRSALLRLEQRPGPMHSKGRGGSSFKAPRKFETPVSKFALQQVTLSPSAHCGAHLHTEVIPRPFSPCV